VAPITVRNWLTPAQGPDTGWSAGARGGARCNTVCPPLAAQRATGLPQNAVAALNALTTAGVGQFNRKYPQGLPSSWGGQGAERVNGVHYYSWSGTLQDNLLQALDPVHIVCRGLSEHFVAEAGQNDGFVGRYSSHLGRVIRSDYPFSHLGSLRRPDGVKKPARIPSLCMSSMLNACGLRTCKRAPMRRAELCREIAHRIR
jgi:hypothetical protein